MCVVWIVSLRADVNAGQRSCSARWKRHRFGVERLDQLLVFIGHQLSKDFTVDWFCRWNPLLLLSAGVKCIYYKTWSSTGLLDSILSDIFSRLLSFASNPRTLFSVSFSDEFPSFPTAILDVRGSIGLLLRRSIVHTVQRFPGYSAGRGADPARGAPGGG
ncbi:hypothetical protein F511_34510 [Dorcoceras hygrometricum]|uniref:Uncharacterized protein n=1 Tax=Dorcoceras hygrometricum TaxID=472368 RepID=A0A2Z7C4L5_9LAMI|nr:hypothetical protein F511_34510 [Dorcoceras hygrometricum]